MQGFKRKLVYACLFEGLAIIFTTVGLSVFAGHDSGHASAAAVASSTIAFVWNFIFNGLFERWEARQPRRGRNFARRAAHALGFEGGLVVMLVPLFAWWLGISLWEALVLDFGLIVFFMIYTYLFNLGFDRVFGLPSSAMPLSSQTVQAMAPATTSAPECGVCYRIVRYQTLRTVMPCTFPRISPIRTLPACIS